MTPAWAARPACIGLVIVPKTSRTPAAWVPPMPSARDHAVDVEAERACRRRRGAEDAHGAGDVPALVVVPGVDGDAERGSRSRCPGRRR